MARVRYAHTRIEGGLADSVHLNALVAGDEGAVRSRALDGAPRLVARLDPGTGARPGSRISLCVDPARVYVFDPVSGRSLVGAGRP
jgi:hypothetical protein